MLVLQRRRLPPLAVAPPSLGRSCLRLLCSFADPRCHHRLLLAATLLLSVLGNAVVDARSIPLGDDPVVETASGRLRGKRIEFDGSIVNTFLGVPYAKPPVGSRRFHPPEMVDPWQGEYLAQTLSPACAYALDKMFPGFPGAEMWNAQNNLSEDCLSMNIWVPEKHDGSVMVWIYGGGFFSGSPSLDLYDGKVLASMQHTIVVNINYRLVAFGFLYLGEDSPVSGNMGLLDQQMALRWLHENIVFFGGDPHRVTLFGESAGGASTTAHLFAPDSEKFFSKIICNSGVITNSWATKPKDVMLNLSTKLAFRLGCMPLGTDEDHLVIGRDDMKAVIDCMTMIHTDRIINVSETLGYEIQYPMAFPFVPVDEDPLFFRGSLQEKLRRHDFKKNVSAILGTVKDEGTYWLPYYLEDTGFHFNHTLSSEDRANQALIGETEYERSVDKFMPYFGESQLVKHALLSVYKRVSTSTNALERLRDGIGRFVGDYFFTCSLLEFADFLADNVYGSVYVYDFTRRSTTNPWPQWMGIMHGYEIEYIFGVPFGRQDTYRTDEVALEQDISRKIMSYWKNFVLTGRPVSTWPRYNRISKSSFVLNEKVARTDKGDVVKSDELHLQCALLREAKSYRKPTGAGGDCGTASDPSLPHLVLPPPEVPISSALNAAWRPGVLLVLLFAALLLFFKF